MSMIMYLFSPKQCAVTRGNRETQVGETIAMLKYCLNTVRASVKESLPSEVSKSV